MNRKVFFNAFIPVTVPGLMLPVKVPALMYL